MSFITATLMSYPSHDSRIVHRKLQYPMCMVHQFLVLHRSCVPENLGMNKESCSYKEKIVISMERKVQKSFKSK